MESAEISAVSIDKIEHFNVMLMKKVLQFALKSF